MQGIFVLGPCQTPNRSSSVLYLLRQTCFAKVLMKRCQRGFLRIRIRPRLLLRRHLSGLDHVINTLPHPKGILILKIKSQVLEIQSGLCIGIVALDT